MDMCLPVYFSVEFEEFFDNVEYKWNKGFDKEMIKRADVCIPKENFCLEDYLSGSYKGVSFEHADVSWKTSSGDDVTSHNYRLIAFDFTSADLSSGKISR